MHTIKKYHGLQGEEGQRSQAAGVCEGPGVRTPDPVAAATAVAGRGPDTATEPGPMETSMERTGGEDADTTVKKKGIVKTLCSFDLRHLIKWGLSNCL
jgi:hypothetical protein